MPAAVLVLVVLGAIAVDSAVVFLAQRELAGAAAAAANDAAAEALDDAALYRSGAVTLDPARAAAVAGAAVAARQSQGLRLVGTPVVRVAGRQVCVRLVADVDHVFAPAVPGVRPSSTVSARAVATSRQAGAPAVTDLGLC
jgi:Flp pilus assembly protein TadG